MLLALNPFSIGQDCLISEDIQILPLETTDLILNVSGLINDDLSSSQAVCGVRLVFEHDRIENIRMVLTSPSGQEITLIGPGRINSISSSFINWNILFNDCMSSNAPDPGLSEQWDNTDNWAMFSNYTGTYDPFSGCLEDFNMGSAIGSWVLSIENLGEGEGLIQYFELIFCDPTGSLCEDCLVDAGSYDFPPLGGYLSVCEGLDVLPALLTLKREPILYGDQEFRYIISRGDEIISIEEDPSSIGLNPPGLYTVCALSYNLEDRDQILLLDSMNDLNDLIENRSICAALTDECLRVEVLPIVNEILVDTVFCVGDTIMYRGVEIVEEMDTVFIVRDFVNNRCDSVIRFAASVEQLDASIFALDTIVNCGESIFLDGSQSTSNINPIVNYQWSTMDGSLLNDVGPFAELDRAGIYQLYVANGLCEDSIAISIVEDNDLEFELEIEEKTCYEDSIVIHLNSIPGAAAVSFEANATVFQIDANSFYSFEPGDYEVFVEFGNCEDSLSFDLEDNTAELELEVFSSIIDCDNSMSEITINTNAVDPVFNITGPQDLLTDELLFMLQEAGVYSVELIDANMCRAEFIFEVMEDLELPEYSVNDINIDCDESVPGFDLNVNSPYDSIIWLGPNGYSSQLEQSRPVLPGLYYFTIYGANQCNVTDSVSFEVMNVEFGIDISGDPLDCINRVAELCVNSSDILDSVQWSYQNSIVGDEVCEEFDQAGIYELIAYSGLCSSVMEFELLDLSEEIEYSLILTSEFLSCDRDSIFAELDFELPATDLSIEWYLEDEFISNESSLSISEAGNYSIELEDTRNQCTELVEFEIINEENSLSDIEVEIIQAVCYPELGEVILSGLPVNTAFGVFLNDEIVDFRDLPSLELVADDYVLEIIDENSCMFTTNFTIEEGRQVLLDLGDDINALPGLEISINATTNLPFNELAEFSWSAFGDLSCMDCLDPSYFPYENELISLTITDIFGCKALDTLQIFIREDQIYFIPDIFSPNGDGNNDDFIIYLSDAISKVFDFRIFDRWGNLLLFRPEISGDSSNFVWDGSFSDGKAELGVYVYMAKLLLVDGSERQIFGELSLVR